MYYMQLDSVHQNVCEVEYSLIIVQYKKLTRSEMIFKFNKCDSNFIHPHINSLFKLLLDHFKITWHKKYLESLVLNQVICHSTQASQNR